MCWWSPTCVCSSSNYIVPPATSLTTEMVMDPLFSNLLSSAHCSTERSNICGSTFDHNIFKRIMFCKELIIRIPYMYEFVIPHSIQIRQKQVRHEEIFVPMYQHTYCAQGWAVQIQWRDLKAERRWIRFQETSNCKGDCQLFCWEISATKNHTGVKIKEKPQKSTFVRGWNILQ